jgi:hypothetical protein
MTSIRAIGSGATSAYQPVRIAARAPDSTPTPAINPADRVDKLTRQLDSSLTDKIARIRERIASPSSTAPGTAPAPRRLDVRA